MKSNGWKQIYRRAIEVDISNAYAKDDVGSGGILWPIIIGGVTIIVIGGVSIFIIAKKQKNKKAKEV